MKFSSIEINNFRNFDSIKVDIGNKNVFFGMNDIGKTNFLYALRYMLDRDIRRRDLIDSDFHKRNISTNIEIVICVDITDIDSPDTQKLRAKLKGAVVSADTEVFIRFVAAYSNVSKCAEISMQWGGNTGKLTEMRSINGFFDIDGVFNVIYISSYVDLHDLFKKNIRALIKNDETTETGDNVTESIIKTKVDEINQEISKLSGVQAFQDKLTPSYRKMRDESVSITIKSDFAINYLYSNIVPFIHQDGDDNEYPTAGEGRKKLLAYSVYNILSEDSADKRINIFLVEEPETHLHRSMQSALSYFLFDNKANNNMLKYLFISTHSPFVLGEMDDVNLVRLYNADKITAASETYAVPDDWKTAKKKLNRALSEAVFADSVLLVEGESECVLFERVMAVIDPYYESKGIFILCVEGIGFKRYIDVLSALNIHYVIKTDNDVTKIPRSKPAIYLQAGFNRINGLIKYIDPLVTVDILPINRNLSKADSTPARVRKHYKSHVAVLDDIRKRYQLYLSHCDLEEDINECLGRTRLCNLLGKTNSADPINLLKSKKQYMMVELAGKLTKSDCHKIYNHYNFACLKAVRNEIQ